jgi:hypothetical protein
MKEELDKQLVERFPRIFRDRFKPMTETAMCWGFECGDGWFDILESLCSQIDHHIKWKRKMRVYDLRLARAKKKGYDAVLDYLTKGKEPSMWDEDRAQEIMEQELRLTPYVHWVVADQVKEKFGGLRFYYHGGDDEVSGMVRMAESWAAKTCETCGERGELRHGGWIRTLCDKHEAEYQERNKKFRSEDDDV